MKSLCAIWLCALLVACTDEPIIANQLMYGDMTGEIDIGHNANPIRLRCESGCKTISSTPTNFTLPQFALTSQQKASIHRFLKQQSRHETVYIASCDGIPLPCNNNRRLASLVAKEIRDQGYNTWITQPVFPIAPYHLQPQCVNLLRGKLAVILPRCPNLNVLDTVYHIDSNFGCSQARALASMIHDPWDLIVAPNEEGAKPSARIIYGNKNYNEGKRIHFGSRISSIADAQPTIITQDN